MNESHLFSFFLRVSLVVNCIYKGCKRLCFRLYLTLQRSRQFLIIGVYTGIYPQIKESDSDPNCKVDEREGDVSLYFFRRGRRLPLSSTEASLLLGGKGQGAEGFEEG